MEEMHVEQTNKKRGAWQVVYALVVLIPSLFFWGFLLVLFIGFLSILYNEDMTCNIARIPIHGVLTSTDNGIGELLGMGVIVSADSVIKKITDAEDDENVVAILLDVDSPGGTPLAGDEIMSALLDIQKPVVAVVRDRGTSAAYWAISGADYIVASPVSAVGSIGVTMSYLEVASSTELTGSRWIDLSSGLYKDAGNPERILTEQEKEYFQSQVDSAHAYMIDRISTSRTRLQKEELTALADGRAYFGEEALRLKLIDVLGGFSEAITYLQETLTMNEEDVVLCEAQGSGLGDLLY
ncbi:MAG: putative protease [Parcubacteria group bacterium GW2011_GWA2_43_11]|nr:MAG: putative protease [Parcubacteria group bacterium GW2011_GWC2_42_11]KKS86229.1 MAG: putative protease [Parcubacteria group bacterium GW2011_GWA2_43_11]